MTKYIEVVENMLDISPEETSVNADRGGVIRQVVCGGDGRGQGWTRETSKLCSFWIGNMRGRNYICQRRMN